MINYALNKYNRCKLSINGDEIKNISEALHCVIALCHCTVSLHCVTALCHCTVSLHCVTVLCHCTVTNSRNKLTSWHQQ